MSDTFMDAFFASESLCHKNYFECEHCGADKAWRKFYLKDPPEVLTISLKRFNNNLSKNNAVVKPPYRLDL
jgi:ubiquitin C-terminal hydrolase